MYLTYVGITPTNFHCTWPRLNTPRCYLKKCAIFIAWCSTTAVNYFKLFFLYIFKNINVIVNGPNLTNATDTETGGAGSTGNTRLGLAFGLSIASAISAAWCYTGIIRKSEKYYSWSVMISFHKNCCLLTDVRITSQFGTHWLKTE